MKKVKSLYALTLLAFFITNVLSFVPFAAAENVAALGEIRSNGKVFVMTSVGQWANAGQTYPLLSSTSIRTEEGTATMYFKDGSRLSLSSNTAAIIDGASNEYSVKLGKGVMAFNIAPNASLSVATDTTNVFAGKKGIVQKVSSETAGRVLGVITVNDKGTDVKSISGRIQVSLNSSETRFVAAGESIFVDSMSGNARVHKTQAAGAPDSFNNSEILNSHYFSGSAQAARDAGYRLFSNGMWAKTGTAAYAALASTAGVSLVGLGFAGLTGVVAGGSFVTQGYKSTASPSIP